MNAPSIASECWFLTGPTASGKTGVGIELARLLGAEIISLDSMAIYRGMDIGTAKPTPDERRQAPHYLIDIVSPDEEYSVARYVEAAWRTAAEIRGRGREVLFVGGTPLYLKSLLRGLFNGPEADWDFRRQIVEELATIGPNALYERLQQVDPLAASKLHPNDTRRLIRALEVYKITGQPISHLQMQFDEGREPDECRVFVLDRPIPELHQLIDRRVDGMFSQGLVEEVRHLTSDGRTLGRTASQAVGYREVLDLLAGKCAQDEAVANVKTRTRRFAKRQRTWFRSLSECRFVPVSGEMDAKSVAQQIIDAVEPAGSRRGPNV